MLLSEGWWCEGKDCEQTRATLHGSRHLKLKSAQNLSKCRKTCSGSTCRLMLLFRNTRIDAGGMQAYSMGFFGHGRLKT